MEERWDEKGNAIIKKKVSPWTCSRCGTINNFTNCSVCGAHVDGKYESKTKRVVSPNTMNRLSDAVLTRNHSKKEIEEMANDAFKKSDKQHNRSMVGIGEGTKKKKENKKENKKERKKENKKRKKEELVKRGFKSALSP